MFSNPEEELIVAESELCIDYDVSGETENEVSVDFDGVEMTPWRRIVVFTADKLDDIIRNVRQNFPAGSQAWAIIRGRRVSGPSLVRPLLWRGLALLTTCSLPPPLAASLCRSHAIVQLVSKHNCLNLISSCLQNLLRIILLQIKQSFSFQHGWRMQVVYLWNWPELPEHRAPGKIEDVAILVFNRNFLCCQGQSKT